MSATILLKRSSTPGAVPQLSDLTEGEVAVNLADRKIYIHDGAAVVRLDQGYVQATAPALVDSQEGDLWFDTVNKLMMSFDGSTWKAIGYRKLGELENVSTAAPANKNLLVWDQPTQLWKPMTAATAGLSVTGHTHTLAEITDFAGNNDNWDEAYSWGDHALMGYLTGAHNHPIAEITGLQAALDGKSATGHLHTIANITGLQAALDSKSATGHAHAIADTTGLQAALDGKSATGHGHAIGDVTDLQSELDGKSDTGHGHAIADVTGLQTALDGKSATGHVHAISGVTGLQTALDGKAASSHVHIIGNITGLQTELNNKSDVGHVHTIANVSGLQTALDGKATSTHIHTIADVTNLQTTLDGKASSSHTHDISGVTGLQTALDGKAGTSHSHTIAEVSGLQTALDGKLSPSTTEDIIITNAVAFLRLLDTNNDQAGRMIASGGYLAFQSGASGSGATTSSGTIRFSGYGGDNINDFQVQHGGAWQDIWHTGNDGNLAKLDATATFTGGDLIVNRPTGNDAILRLNNTTGNSWSIRRDDSDGDALQFLGYTGNSGGIKFLPQQQTALELQTDKVARFYSDVRVDAGALILNNTTGEIAKIAAPGNTLDLYADTLFQFRNSNDDAVNSWILPTGGIWTNGSFWAESEVQADGNIVSGFGGGGAALTVNDSEGNANVTFNHANGIPEQNGNSGRIIVNTDATSNAKMSFQIKSNVTKNVAVGMSPILELLEGAAEISGTLLVENDLTVDTNAHINNLYVGSADNLQLFSTGTYGAVRSATGESLYVDSRGGNFTVRLGTSYETGLTAAPNGSVDLYYNNSKKLSTTTDGADITGALHVDTVFLANKEKSNLSGDGQLGFDSSQGLLVYRTQQGVSGEAVTVLDGANVSAGNGITISNLGGGGTGTDLFTFAIDEASVSQAEAGTNATDVMTPRRVASAINARSFGESHTWSDKSGSRAANTSYQNTNDYPIMIMIRPSATGGGKNIEVSTNNSTWLDVTVSGAVETFVQTAIVPPGHYYRFTAGFSVWNELR